jgi:hypothetical protein
MPNIRELSTLKNAEAQIKICRLLVAHLTAIRAWSSI